MGDREWDADTDEDDNLPRRQDEQSAGRNNESDLPATRDADQTRPATHDADRTRPAKRESDRPTTREEHSPAQHSSSRRRRSTEPSRAGKRRRDRPRSSERTLTDAVTASATKPVSVETTGMAATLAGITEVDLEQFVYDHQLDESHRGEGLRPVALFDLENTSDRPIRWRSARTKFIGDDGYTYRPAHISLEPSTLGPGCHTRQVEIEPGSKARVVTLVERLPEGVSIEKVVQTIPAPGPGGSERLVFPVG